MAALHLVGGPAAETLARCLARAGEGDAILLLGEAVAGSTALSPQDGAAGKLLRAAAGRVTVHILVPDLEQREIEPSKLEPGCIPVDYRGFVALTERHSPIVSWY